MILSAGARETILGIDIGGTKTALMAISRDMPRKLAQASFETPHDTGPGALLDLVRIESHAMLTHAGIDPGSVRAVGCAVPGQVDAEGVVIGAGNLDGWRHVPLQALLGKAWNVPAFVEQDANTGALGEMWVGAARTMSDFVFLALGTGVGAGIVLGRGIHRGVHHAAGELGDLVLDRGALGRGPPARHNLSSRIGSRALRWRAHRATGHEVPAADVVNASAGDPRLTDIAEDMVDDLAVTVIAIASILDPEAIFFGGGTAAASEELIARVRARVKGELWIDPMLLRSALGEQAQLYGAVAGALARLDPDFALSNVCTEPG